MTSTKCYFVEFSKYNIILDYSFSTINRFSRFVGVFLIFIINLTDSTHFQDESNLKESSLVEVRAVFINCQIDENYPYGGEPSRFQRDEILKHNALRDCKRKLALTVKMTTDFSQSLSDEYIPIEHVFDGSNKKRVRLLNPYILRLHRDPPYEAYKLRELDTFSGILTNSNEKTFQRRRQTTKDRIRRNSIFSNLEDLIAPKLDKGPLLYVKDDKKFYNNRNTPDFNIASDNIKEIKNITDSVRFQNEKYDDMDTTEKIFKLYEVGEPDVWFMAQVQLLEKLSTSEGKTVWKDLTKDNPARISSLHPKWTNQDVNIRYRHAEWVPKEDFTLSSAGICLLLPHNEKTSDGFSNDKIEDFIIVPFEDIQAIEESTVFKRNHENTSFNCSSVSEHRSRILIRLSRAIFGRNEDNFMIINEGDAKYLRVPYRQAHHAILKLEAKADENQLVYVGSSGRLTTVVSESTRRSRAILTVQATNTGLAAAHLRPTIRECSPELLRFNEDEVGAVVTPILIPPMHTHKFILELPLQTSGDIAHCSLALLNDHEESVAVRDVRIKRGDRCFCVWYCQCVCLNEDPKLFCQEMMECQQVAAGLTPRDRSRQVRAACYPDTITTNILVTVFGVILLLLILGLVKACLGIFLRCVGLWGIDQLLQTPRRLDRYYEFCLRSRPVVYDEDGWPVHPDTMKRTVRFISRPMEFMLNVIFFITLPCLLLWKSIKLIISHWQNKKNKNDCDFKTNVKKCYHDNMQGKDGREAHCHWRRRKHLRRWMSPQAEKLSTDIWRNGLTPQGYSSPECMRPLLRDDRFRGKLYKLHSPVVDSENEDSEYVLMQMKHSRDSLANEIQELQRDS